ncbi:Hypothetical predicted protein [Olea europaea subsp. europaea]|uniref:Uncharacterized protein n=1 Tax=Olea europaea subsp. europaea TaxID=158383 RepID=A0A8S0QJ62_OLEEU|nr:Hypothetical predicted protein [Olea europaea subsp. europaea]
MSAQLIQQLVFRTICIDKVYKLWFNVEGHFMRFDLQEYALVMGLRYGVFLEGGERLPQLLRWSARKQSQHRMCDAFFKNVKFHVYVTLRLTDAEAQQPYFSTLVPYDDPSMLVLDDISVREDSDDEGSKEGSGVKQTSGGDDEDGRSGSDRDGEDTKDTGVSHSDRSSAEYRSLREFIAILVAPVGPTTAAIATITDTEVDVSGSLPEDIYRGHVEPCSDEQDTPVDIRTPQDGRQIDLQFGILDVNDAGAMEPSNAAWDDDEEVKGCDATDGDGVVIEVPVPSTVPDARAGVPIM